MGVENYSIRDRVWLERVTPPEMIEGLPCSVVACCCAFVAHGMDIREAVKKVRTAVKDLDIHFKGDGWLTLDQMNKLVRTLFAVRRRRDFRRGERPTLSGLCSGNYDALVCVLGHFVYLRGCKYWSYFDNKGQEVVAIWELER